MARRLRLLVGICRCRPLGTAWMGNRLDNISMEKIKARFLVLASADKNVLQNKGLAVLL